MPDFKPNHTALIEEWKKANIETISFMGHDYMLLATCYPNGANWKVSLYQGRQAHLLIQEKDGQKLYEIFPYTEEGSGEERFIRIFQNLSS